MLYGNEIFPLTEENEIMLNSAETRIIRWMCCVKWNKPSCVQLRKRLGIDDLLSFYGHSLDRKGKLVIFYFQ